MTDLRSGTRRTSEIQETRANESQGGQHKSFERTHASDKAKGAELRKIGPDILTGNNYSSQIYRGRLDRRHETKRWEGWRRIKDSRKAIVEDINNEFMSRFRRLNDFVGKQKEEDVLKKLGLNPRDFIDRLKEHKEYFDKYQRKALEYQHTITRQSRTSEYEHTLIYTGSGTASRYITRAWSVLTTTQMRNQAFDRMLAHLDMLQSYEQQVQDCENGNDASRPRLDKDSLDRVYKSLKDNYEGCCALTQEKTEYGPDSSIDQHMERLSRTWYRALLILSDEVNKRRKSLEYSLKPRRETIGGLQQGDPKTSQEEVQRTETLQQILGPSAYRKYRATNEFKDNMKRLQEIAEEVDEEKQWKMYWEFIDAPGELVEASKQVLE